MKSIKGHTTDVERAPPFPPAAPAPAFPKGLQYMEP